MILHSVAEQPADWGASRHATLRTAYRAASRTNCAATLYVPVSFLRGIDDSHTGRLGPVAPAPGAREQRRDARSGRLGAGTLACARCDAPVALTQGPLSPSHPLICPFCSHRAPLRDFLSLAAPTRPARVVVRVVQHDPRI